MKKIITIILMLATMLTATGIGTLASETDYFYDGAYTTTVEEEETLEARIDQFTAQFNIGFYIVTIGENFDIEYSSLEELGNTLVADYGYQSTYSDGIILIHDYNAGDLLLYPFGDNTEIFTQDVLNGMIEDANNFTGTSFYTLYDAILARAAGAASAYTGLEAPSGIAPVVDGEYTTLYDGADLFTEEQEATLEDRITDIKETYNFDVTLLTVADTGSVDLVRFADDYRGIDDNSDGVIFARNPISREYATSARNYGETAFTYPDAFDKIDDIVIPYLQNDQDYDAFIGFLDFTEEVLELSYSGTPYQTSFIDSIQLEVLLMAIVPGFLLAMGATALFVTGPMKAKMNTAVKQTHAQNYVVDNSFMLTDSKDVFVSENTSRTRKASSSGGGGGGGSRSNSFGGSRTSRGGRA